MSQDDDHKDNDTLRACLRKARLANEQLRARVEALMEENRVLKLANASFATPLLRAGAQKEQEEL